MDKDARPEFPRGTPEDRDTARKAMLSLMSANRRRSIRDWIIAFACIIIVFIFGFDRGVRWETGRVKTTCVTISVDAQGKYLGSGPCK